MKLYSITITAHVDDLEALDVRLEADIDLPAESLRGVVMSILPAHLRKVATDVATDMDAL